MGTELAQVPEDISAPKNRPAPAGHAPSRAGFILGVLISLGIHIAILIMLFAIIAPDEIGSAGGFGWADEIEIRASRESSSGLEGDPGSTAEDQAVTRQNFDVSIVYAPPPPPPPPEPEEYLPDEEEEEEEEEEPVEEVVEEEPEPEQDVIEDALIEEEDQEEEPVEELAPEGDFAIASQEALVDTSAEGTGGGEGGLNDELAGSPIGSDEQGLGAGVADAGREGAFVPGDQIRSLLSGWTLIGNNGFSDGSTGASTDNRRDIPWRVYYAPNGRLTARYYRYGSHPNRPRGDRGYYWYERNGTWTIEGDVLCQRIERWGSGGTTCFEVRRDGENIAMYYEFCRGVSRCWVGRLGPYGIMRTGRHLRN